MLNLTSLECSCQYRVKNGYMTASLVGECCGEFDTLIAILWSDTENAFVGTIQDAARCKSGKVAVMVQTGVDNNLRGWGELILWSSQRQNTNQGRVGPGWKVNTPAHDKAILNKTYTLLNCALIQGSTFDSEFLG